MEQLQKKTIELLNEVITSKTEITEETLLVEELSITSLQVMELLALAEDEFDILIPASSAFDAKCVKDLADILQKHIEVDA